MVTLLPILTPPPITIPKGCGRHIFHGSIASGALVSNELLAWMLEDPYIARPIPKTTGRELYGSNYVERLVKLTK
ncbi:hypothetical protein EOM81_02080, partial [bacterium]|nr:hypothetical protein [bacterium]